MTRFLTTLIFVAAGAPAYAICPTEADLSGGIRFDTANGEWEVFQAHAPNVLEARYHFNALSWQQNRLAGGLYLIEDVFFDMGRPDPASAIRYRFALEPDAMPQPIPGAVWATHAETTTQDGRALEEQIYEFGDFTTLDIGACTYRMMPIVIRYPIEEQSLDTTSLIYWLPDLGLSYLAASTFGGKTDRYTYVGVSAVRALR